MRRQFYLKRNNRRFLHDRLEGDIAVDGDRHEGDIAGVLYPDRSGLFALLGVPISGVKTTSGISMVLSGENSYSQPDILIWIGERMAGTLDFFCFVEFGEDTPFFLLLSHRITPFFFLWTSLADLARVVACRSLRGEFAPWLLDRHSWTSLR